MALLRRGATVGQRYVIVEKLATGGMAEVYLADQRGPSGFSKHVVLKVILPQLAADRSFVAMFLNEAKLAALLDHPGIVQVFDFGVDGELHYIAMEHVDGVNLRQVIGELARHRRRMPRPLALHVAARACRALHHAHTLTGAGGRPLQIVHRDVSLENILVAYTGQLKLADFGIAKARTMESYTRTGALKGKFEYMPPEVIEGKAPDHRMDIYAMGVVLYLLLLGRAPFVGENEIQLLDSILLEPPPSPRELDPALPPRLERILLRSLAKQASERFSSALELATALEQEQRSNRRAGEDELGRLVTELLPPQHAAAAAGGPARQLAFPTPRPDGPLQIDPTLRDALPRFFAGQPVDPAELPALPVPGESPADGSTEPLPPILGGPTEEMSGLPEHLADPTEEVDPASLPTLPVPSTGSDPNDGEDER
jgi:serine/threonine protein kinase